MQNNKNVFIATILSVAVLIGWTLLYEKPKRERQLREIEIAQELSKARISNQSQENSQNSNNNQIPAQTPNQQQLNINDQKVDLIFSRDQVINKTSDDRIKILSDNLHGSILLQGARFDDLTLAKYFRTTKNQKEVILLSPSTSTDRYFVDFGWVSSNQEIELPTPNTLWKADKNTLGADSKITLSWVNKQNIEFQIIVALDKNYMFQITQNVINNSDIDVSIATYGRINRVLNNVQKSNFVLHEGIIGNIDNILKEVNYSKLNKERNATHTDQQDGWIGITDKYWLTSIIPDKKTTYKTSYNSEINNRNNLFNIDFISEEYLVKAKNSNSLHHNLFAGAKEVELIDSYAEKYDIKLFDRAIDFGWFYFITKPFFYIIEYIYKFVGNFGIAIIIMTVLIKLALYPMANKSFTAIARIKKLQPKIDEIKTKYKDDKLALNKEIMALYKKEGVSPAAGCLPLLIQIPIFYSLYKVLYVTIDMRHAPFYGWIKDLSAPDPTSIFNLFGLLPFEVSSTFTIGVWPILMGLTMIIQQKLSPTSGDPVQTKILKFMPYALTFVLASFPAGLVIYWTWSNILSILQQYFIMKKVTKSKK